MFTKTKVRCKNDWYAFPCHQNFFFVFYNTTFISSSLNSEMEGFSDQISQLQRASRQQYMWTDDEIICQAENEKYYAKRLEAVAQAKMTGPQKLPKPPKRKLDKLFREKTKGKKNIERSSADLQEYLMKNLVDINQKANRKFFTQLEPSFDQLKKQLIYGYKQIQRHKYFFFICNMVKC